MQLAERLQSLADSYGRVPNPLDTSKASTFVKPLIHDSKGKKVALEALVGEGMSLLVGDPGHGKQPLHGNWRTKVRRVILVIVTSHSLFACKKTQVNWFCLTKRVLQIQCGIGMHIRST